MFGMSEIEQLHTAIPYGEGEMNELVRTQLLETAPSKGVVQLISGLLIFFAIVLIYLGIGLIQFSKQSIVLLKWWSICFIVLKLSTVALTWLPRGELIRDNSEIKGMFLAQLLISVPMYLILPIFLLIFLNKSHIKSEISSWR